MNNTIQSPSEEIFDARELPCAVKRPAVIGRCVNLPVGSSYVLLNDHDPVPLRAFLDREFPGCFRWEYVPDLGDVESVAIRVTKLATPTGGFGTPEADFSCHSH